MKTLAILILILAVAYSYKGYKNFDKLYNVEVLNEGGYGIYPKKGD